MADKSGLNSAGFGRNRITPQGTTGEACGGFGIKNPSISWSQVQSYGGANRAPAFPSRDAMGLATGGAIRKNTRALSRPHVVLSVADPRFVPQGRR